MSMFDYAPGEIRALPFNMRRSHLYPLNPPTADQAIQDALEGQHADAYLPQRMTYSRYKNGPAAIQYGENVVGVLASVEPAESFVNSVVGPIEDGKGIYTPAQASRDFVRLPQAQDNMYFEEDPLTRGLLQRPIVQAPGLNAYAMTSSQPVAKQPDVYAQSLIADPLEYPNTPPLTSIGLGRIKRGVRGHAKRMLKRGIAGLGAAAEELTKTDASSSAQPLPAQPVVSSNTVNKTAFVAYGLLGAAGLGLGLYHGWKRTHSTPWTVVWGLAGAWFPVVALPVMFIQGFGKKG